MSDEIREQMDRVSNIQSAMHCDPTAEGRCATCSDEALPAQVLRVDAQAGLALVTMKGTTEEVDITLVDGITPGDIILVHGGVAIANAKERSVSGGSVSGGDDIDDIDDIRKGSHPASQPLPPLREEASNE
jgi:hydrogenase maturation factor